jgi:valyl-tRNA synthetase
LLYQFVWHEFCDWYIELIKPRLNDDGGEKETVQHVLLTTLEAILRMLHPFMPFITEELWQYLNPGKKSIMIADYPEADESLIDKESEEKMQLLIDVISSIRNIRGEMEIAPSTKINVVLNFEKENNVALFQEKSSYISSLARVNELKLTTNSSRIKSSASAVIHDIQIFVPLEGLKDTDEEIKRLEKKLQKVAKELQFFEKKFSNKGYLAKAPKEVVEKDRLQYSAFQEQQKKLEQHLQRLRELND